MENTIPVKSEYPLYKLVQKNKKLILPTVWKEHASYAGFYIQFSSRQILIHAIDGTTHWFQYTRLNWETKTMINRFIVESIVKELIKENEDAEVQRLLRKFKIDPCRELPEKDVQLVEDLVAELMAVDKDDNEAVRNVYLNILKVKDVSLWKQMKHQTTGLLKTLRFW